MNKWIKDLENRIEYDYFKTLGKATNEQLQFAISRKALSELWRKWLATKNLLYRNKVKMAYYFSAEFLMGRWLGNTLINLGEEKVLSESLKTINIDYNTLEEVEADAGLGNGGLGRLAACFLDSMATHNLPVMGYGIRYRFGMFEQKIVNNEQIELPDNWLRNGDPVGVKRDDKAVKVKFGGHVKVSQNKNGDNIYSIEGAEEVVATPYDIPVIGYKTDTVLTLRLWQASSPDGFDLNLFQNEHYTKAVEKENRAEDISRVLYPGDSGPSGKTLRLRQQYFFVSASLQDIIVRYKEIWGNDIKKLPEAVSVQMNDTHPAIAVAELMRLLVDEEGLGWDEAWQITIKCCAYTNHTVLAEALEMWPIDIFAALMPRHYQIIEEINRRFLGYLRSEYPNNWHKQGSMSIIGDGKVKMAFLAIVGSHSVNGVAALHTQILKDKVLRDWYQLFPDKFNNKTNGVTQRRWLLKANPELASFISSKIGEGWITNLDELTKLKPLAAKDDVLSEFMQIKRRNKQKLANYILANNGVSVRLDSIFDVQVKRIHEYKRQLLAALYVIYLYRELKANPNLDIVPRTFIFSGKAASTYKQAKLIIKLINTLGAVINNDTSLNDKLKVVFLANYRVSLAEKIFPASDISEQISTAGYEASGTGNMKFMLNGAITLGTMDGANVEIVEEAGAENAFIFGLSSDEVTAVRASYSVGELLAKDAELAQILDMLVSGPLTVNGDFRELYNSLVHGVNGSPADYYMILKDFRSYVSAQKTVDSLFRNQDEWARRAFLNVASAGKFSSDRTVKEYASEIWNIKPFK